MRGHRTALLACMVALLGAGHAFGDETTPAVSVSEVRFSVSPAEQAYLNALHHPEAIAHADTLSTVFAQLDTNGDGELSQAELTAHTHAGLVTDLEAILLEAFDTDHSGTLSHGEMTLAPYTLNMLEERDDLDHGQEQEQQGTNDANTVLLETSAKFLPPNEPLATSFEMAEAEEAFESEGDNPAPRARSSQRQRRALRHQSRDADDAVLSETSSSVTSTSTVAPQAYSERTKPTSQRQANALPVSRFGVPSVADEECVLCQYFVQRIQIGVAARLEAPPSTDAKDPNVLPSTAPDGTAAAASAAQKALKTRAALSRVSKKPGGRGIVRIVAQELLTQLCAADHMPLLFQPYCDGIQEPNSMNAVRKGIFFNMPTIEVCTQAALCRDDAYINTNAAVHAVKTSAFLNGQRGICGMLGGARDRVDARDGLIISAVCAAHGAIFGQPGKPLAPKWGDQRFINDEREYH